MTFAQIPDDLQAAAYAAMTFNDNAADFAAIASIYRASAPTSEQHTNAVIAVDNPLLMKVDVVDCRIVVFLNHCA